MSVGAAIVLATVLVLATINAGFRKVLGYVALVGLALVALLGVLIVDEEYRGGVVALFLVCAFAAAWLFARHRSPKGASDPLEGYRLPSFVLERYQRHLATILSNERLVSALNDLVKHPSPDGTVAFDGLLEEELRKQAEWDRQHPGLGIYIKAVGGSLAEQNADLQLLGFETLEELMNRPEALKRNPARSIDRHIDFLRPPGVPRKRFSS